MKINTWSPSDPEVYHRGVVSVSSYVCSPWSDWLLAVGVVRISLRDATRTDGRSYSHTIAGRPMCPATMQFLGNVAAGKEGS